MLKINLSEFHRLNKVLERHTGILLSERKKDLMVNRLANRLRVNNLDSFHKYYHLLTLPEGAHELKIFIDKLTTHETYFFREQEQFSFLRDHLTQKKSRSTTVFKVWSAACSTGEEVYSLAMLLDDVLHHRAWEITGTDISPTTIDVAQGGNYALTAASKIPKLFKRKYCLKGIGDNEGSFIINNQLRMHCHFYVDNLLDLSQISVSESFNIIFLRNVLIYFSEVKQKIILESIIKRLKHNGLLFVGHSEAIKGYKSQLKSLQPCIYQRRVNAN